MFYFSNKKAKKQKNFNSILHLTIISVFDTFWLENGQLSKFAWSIEASEYELYVYAIRHIFAYHFIFILIFSLGASFSYRLKTNIFNSLPLKSIIYFHLQLIKTNNIVRNNAFLICFTRILLYLILFQDCWQTTINPVSISTVTLTVFWVD